MFDLDTSQIQVRSVNQRANQLGQTFFLYFTGFLSIYFLNIKQATSTHTHTHTHTHTKQHKTTSVYILSRHTVVSLLSRRQEPNTD